MAGHSREGRTDSSIVSAAGLGLKRLGLPPSPLLFLAVWGAQLQRVLTIRMLCANLFLNQNAVFILKFSLVRNTEQTFTVLSLTVCRGLVITE